VKLGGQLLHTTKTVTKSLNPVWKDEDIVVYVLVTSIMPRGLQQVLSQANFFFLSVTFLRTRKNSHLKFGIMMILAKVCKIHVGRL
jgi:hypothetical protein